MKQLLNKVITISCACLLGALTFISTSCSNSHDEEPMNVVFILADDMGWNQVGYNGTNYYETPNIDRIAREGIRFNNAYSANPVCSPTRSSIMTGKNPARLHITDY
ncbi:MAG: sulfatase-like hydrolase/transferase, partial [Promethearchaeota archaeon]